MTLRTSFWSVVGGGWESTSTNAKQELQHPKPNHESFSFVVSCIHDDYSNNIVIDSNSIVSNILLLLIDSIITIY